MPRLTADQWETVRAEREAGASFPELAARWGVSHQAIQKRAKAEGWSDGRDVGEIVRRKAAEKVAGVVAACNPKKRAEAINAAADRSAEVIRRHQEESNAIRERLYAGLKAHRAAETKEDKQLAFEDLKAAKISSETLLNIHKAERQAWGLEVQAAGEIVIKNPRRFED
jgi:hypothetical protein